jgi:putative ABC transport system ATP-binding protein
MARLRRPGSTATTQEPAAVGLVALPDDTGPAQAVALGKDIPHARVPAARIRDLTKVYGSGQTEVRALDGVSLDLYAGEFTAVMGPSGSGKSTLMHCCAALDDATSGSVVIGDTDLARLKDKDLTLLRRDRIGFVFQSFNLVPTLTAQENILLPLSIAGRRPDSQWYSLVIDAVGLGDRLSHRPNELSGGQQQRVAVARALVSKPAIVFADEPTGNLDSRAGAEVLGLLKRSVHDFGQTVVMVTHDPVAAGYTDRVVFLADGVVVDELRDPQAELVLERMAQLAGAGSGTSGSGSTRVDG